MCPSVAGWRHPALARAGATTGALQLLRTCPTPLANFGPVQTESVLLIKDPTARRSPTPLAVWPFARTARRNFLPGREWISKTPPELRRGVPLLAPWPGSDHCRPCATSAVRWWSRRQASVRQGPEPCCARPHGAPGGGESRLRGQLLCPVYADISARPSGPGPSWPEHSRLRGSKAGCCRARSMESALIATRLTMSDSRPSPATQEAC